MKKIHLPIFGFLMLSLLLNCSAVQGNNPQIQREWMLVSFGNFSKNDLVQKKASMNLTANQKKGKIRGEAFMGCNTLFFSSEFKNNGKLEIKGIGGTLKACQNSELETEFSKKIQNMTKYSVEGHFLTLSNDNGNVMKFIAADWD